MWDELLICVYGYDLPSPPQYVTDGGVELMKLCSQLALFFNFYKLLAHNVIRELPLLGEL